MKAVWKDIVIGKTSSWADWVWYWPAQSDDTVVVEVQINNSQISNLSRETITFHASLSRINIYSLRTIPLIVSGRVTRAITILLSVSNSNDHDAKFLDGKTNKNAVWYYEKPLEGAQAIKDRVAFWKGVKIVE